MNGQKRLAAAFAMSSMIVATTAEAASQNYAAVCQTRSGTSKQGYSLNTNYVFGIRFSVNDAGQVSISDKQGDIPPELKGILYACDLEPKYCDKSFRNNTLKIDVMQQAVATFKQTEYFGIIRGSKDGDNAVGAGRCAVLQVAPRP